MIRKRAATVEPVLGTLLLFTAMKKVYTRGIGLATKYVLMAATAYNIRKLLRFTSSKWVKKQLIRLP